MRKCELENFKNCKKNMNIKVKYVLIAVVFILINQEFVLSNVKDKSFEARLDKIDNNLYNKPDSAKMLIYRELGFVKENQLEKKMILYNRLGKYYSTIQNYDSAKCHFKRALTIAKNMKNKKYEYEQLSYLANTYNQQGIYDTAFSYYNKSINYYDKEKDSIALASNLSNRATAFMAIGKNKEALKDLFKAEKIYRNRRNHTSLGVTYENIAAINAELGYEKLVVEYTRKAIEIYIKQDNNLYLAIAYADLAVALKNSSQKDSALYYFNLSIEMAKSMNDEFLLAKNYLNLGNLYDEINERNKALDNYKKSLKISKKLKIDYGVYLNYINLGHVYLEDSLCDKSIEVLEKAHELLPRIQSPTNSKELYESLYETYKCAGNKTKALVYLEKLVIVKDSLNEALKHREIMDLQTKYDVAKKKATILKLKEKRKNNMLIRYILVSAIIIMGLLLIIIIIKVKQQKKINLQKKLLTEKEIEQVKYRLEQKKQDIISYSLQNAAFSDFLKLVLTHMQKLLPHVKVSGKKDALELLGIVSKQQQNEQYWNEFDMRFKEVNNNFYKKLTESYPTLSSTEIRVCALLHLNMTSKEIAKVMNKSLRTVENFRYRIRKKMGLEADVDLASYLMSI